MTNFYCFISRHAQCSIVFFLIVCTVQNSVHVFADKITKMEGYSLDVTSVASLGCVDFDMAPSPRRNILCDKEI